MSVLAALDEATRAHHAEADGVASALTLVRVTPHQYTRHLVLAYGFEAPLESALALTPRLPLVIDLRARARVGCIVQDLLVLGLRPAKIARLAQCPSIMPLADPLEALGWLYVADRARTADLREHLARVLPDAPVAYLSAPRTDAFDLEAALRHAAPTLAAFDRVITAALAAFECHSRWFAGDVRLSSPDLAIIRDVPSRPIVR
jgi:heme oxygenase